MNIPPLNKVCPGCGSKNMLDGPKGGLSQNLLCKDCGKEWNMSPINSEEIRPPRPELYPYRMIMTVDVILQELEIRIAKLRKYEENERDPDMHRYQRIRRQEYESFKNWIDIRK